jgi:hypothetical protein
MKKIILTLGVIPLSLVGFSQQNTVSSGGDASGTGGSASYTVGQIDYQNVSGTNGSINEGVQQPFEFYTIGIDENELLNVLLFPNPTSDFVVISIEDFKNILNYQLFDTKGKLIIEDLIEAKETSINFKNLAKGSYHLRIHNGAKELQSIKIIKN